MPIALIGIGAGTRTTKAEWRIVEITIFEPEEVKDPNSVSEEV